ncbi:MAG TPA: hypothetical protein VGJ59_17825 [Jatrophihabitantaceae bacterium]|jgi:hypothetical protein
MTTSDLLTTTRDALHRVAEHVLAAGQYAETGEIALRPAAGGFSTTHGTRRMSIAGTHLVVVDVAGMREAPLTTLGAAAAFAGITPGMPASVYPPATPLDLGARLAVDAEQARLLADWYEVTDAALRRFAPGTMPIMWPEHFDVGITVGAVNFGASPGDGQVSRPYAYVGPHDGPPVRDGFWNMPFGAIRTIDEISSVDEMVAFFRAGAERLAAVGS